MKQQQSPQGGTDDRGPGAEKVELERRLDANAEIGRRGGQPQQHQRGQQQDDDVRGRRNQEQRRSAGRQSPSDLGAPEYYAEDRKPTVARPVTGREPNAEEPDA